MHRADLYRFDGKHGMIFAGTTAKRGAFFAEEKDTTEKIQTR